MKSMDKCKHKSQFGVFVASIMRDFTVTFSTIFFADNFIKIFAEETGLKKKDDFNVKRSADLAEEMLEEMRKQNKNKTERTL